MILVVMGVAGAGKTTIGQRLADALGCGFSDADALQPAANREKMRAGQALTDEDRAPWLARLRSEIECWQRQGVSHVLACSALKAHYREVLAAGDPDVSFVYLKIDQEAAAQRVGTRSGHFFHPQLLADQFEALEEPGPDEAIIVAAGQAPEATVRAVLAAIGYQADAAKPIATRDRTKGPERS